MSTRFIYPLLTGLFVMIQLLASTSYAGVNTAATDPIHIVVLPFITESGTDARAIDDTAPRHGNARGHYRRILRYINKQLVRHGFEVINPFAQEYNEDEYRRMMERAREDSALAALNVTKKYGVDVAYLVWLSLRDPVTTADGFCKIQARLEGEGYDSAARDLGAGVEDRVVISSKYCEDALIDAEIEVADRVARTLTAWSGRQQVAAEGSTVVGQPAVNALLDCEGDTQGGAIQREANRLDDFVSVRLDSITEDTQAEIFGKVLNTVRGVYHAKVYRVNLQPHNPQGSWTLWRARIACTDTFRLASNVKDMLRKIVQAGGRLHLNEVEYRYTAAEVDLIKGIRLNNVTSREIQFVLDRKVAMDKESMATDDPYQPQYQEKIHSNITGSDAGFD